MHTGSGPFPCKPGHRTAASPTALSARRLEPRMGNGEPDPTSPAIFPRQWCRPFRAGNHGGIQPGALPRAIVSRPFRAAKTQRQNPTPKPNAKTQLHRNCNLPPQRGSPCQPRATPWEQVPTKFKALKGRSNRCTRRRHCGTPIVVIKFRRNASASAEIRTVHMPFSSCGVCGAGVGGQRDFVRVIDKETWVSPVSLIRARRRRRHVGVPDFATTHAPQQQHGQGPNFGSGDRRRPEPP